MLLALTMMAVLAFKFAAVRRAQSRSCASKMKAIGLAGRLWANDRAEMMPTNFTCMSNELVTPKILHCSADSARPQVDTWEKFTEDSSSYEIISPGAREGTTNVVFIRCRIHGHLGFTDGSVMNASRTKVLPKY